MSLKSFDKFCENIIMGDPVAEKDVYDERQNQLRGKLMTEGFQLYAVLSFLLIIIYEAGGRFCESVVAVLAFCAAASYMWWVLRNLYYGSLFGVKYTNAKNSAATIAAEMIVFGFMIFNNNAEDITSVKRFFIVDGMLTEVFVISLAMVIMFIASVITLVAGIKKDREEKEAAE